MRVSVTGQFRETVKDAKDFRTEFTAETALLRLVPDLRLGNIKFSGATNLDFVVQGVSRSRRALTSGQGD